MRRNVHYFEAQAYDNVWRPFAGKLLHLHHMQARQFMSPPHS